MTSLRALVQLELSSKTRLLLLLLFVIDAVGTYGGGAGLDDEGGWELDGHGSVGRADSDGDAEGALGFAFVDAAGGRNIGIVASEGDADVAVGADQVVGRVEGEPSQAGEEGFNPGVGRAFERAIFFLFGLVAVKHISAHVAAGNAQGTDEGDHDVGEILTD